MSGEFVDAAVLADRLAAWASDSRLRVEARFRGVDAVVPVGEVMDASGSLLLVAPGLVDPPTKEADKKDWHSRWAAIFVAAGYLNPDLDPERLAALLRSRYRLEFILDTSALVSGVGHWLVRRFGERCDLVRTVVTDFEVQRFCDQAGSRAKKPPIVAALESGKFRMASAFLEGPPHPHPIWRILDIDEEGALFSAVQGSGQKGPQLDVLLFRAAKRAILDRVPNLERLFVTGDGGLARGATHDLPSDCVLAGYAPSFEGGSTMTAVAATLSTDGDYRLLRTGLHALVLEALLFCDEILLHAVDKTLFLRGYVPGAHQFPSTWRRRGAWISEQAFDRSPAPSGAPAPPSTWPAPSAGSNSTQAAAAATAWPLLEIRDVAPRDTGARVGAETALVSLSEVVRRLRKKKRVDIEGLKDDVGSLFARLGLIDKEGRAGEAFAAIDAALKANDLDTLWRAFVELRPYHDLWTTLAGAGSGPLEQMAKAVAERQRTAATGLMRALGHAVVEGDTIHFGGASPPRETVEQWLVRTVDRLAAASELGQAPIAAVARAGLQELRVSPYRLSLALHAILERPREGTDIEPLRGGTPQNVLPERIARFQPDGSVEFENVSADGLLGYAALARRAR